MHLVWPKVAALQHRRRASQRARHVAAVQQHARRGRMGAQGRLGLVEIGQGGCGAPGDAELLGGLGGMFLPLGHHADEVSDHHGGDQSRHGRHRGFVHRQQAVADERPGVLPGIRRPHHPAVQHARHPHIVHIAELAGGLGRQVGARHVLAHDAVGCGGFHHGVLRQPQVDALPGYQLAIADMLVAVPGAHGAVLHHQRVRWRSQPLRRTGDQSMPRRCRRQTQRHCGDLDGFAGKSGALVGRLPGMAEHHGHPLEGHVQLFRHDLRQRGADAGAEVDMAAESGDGAIRVHCDEHLAAAQHQQHAAGGEQLGAAEFGRHRHAAWPQARCTARRISTWVPQRHRLCRNAWRICASLGRGVWASRALAAMIMPFRQ